MIDVICKSDAYTYNVYHIMKAFFPSEEIKVRTEEEASHYLMVRLPDGADSADGKAGKKPQDTGWITIGEEQAAEAAGDNGDEDEERQLKYCIDTCLYHELEKRTGRSLALSLIHI